MGKYFFNIKLELDKAKVDYIIDDAITKRKKGYVCSVERNIITTAYYDENYRSVVNNALVNILDGSIVGLFLSFALGRKVESYIGADLFIKYIASKKYKSYFLGNTGEVLEGLRSCLASIDKNVLDMQFISLPFLNVDDFDYCAIAENIKRYNPDIIWISLGAPKQELFMSNLLPYLSNGIMFGFGAIFNFYSGIKKYQRAPKFFLKLKLEWLHRVFQEPKKNIKRNWDFLKITPLLIRDQVLYEKTLNSVREEHDDEND